MRLNIFSSLVILGTMGLVAGCSTIDLLAHGIKTLSQDRASIPEDDAVNSQKNPPIVDNTPPANAPTPAQVNQSGIIYYEEIPPPK